MGEPFTSRVLGPFAIAPQAVGLCFELPPPAPPVLVDTERGIALVAVRGPLEHHEGPRSDSFDAVKARVAAAIGTGARSVVLSIDSPGGAVSGCFDTARELRAMADAAGVRLVSYVDGTALSAGYCLAAAGHEMWIPSGAVAGSIGVLDTVPDVTAADRAAGLKFVCLVSGARKTDGNPHVEQTPEALAARQVLVDRLAGEFFATVARLRPGLTPEALAALEAGQFVGADAVRLGLADSVGSLDEVLAGLGPAAMGPQGPKEQGMNEIMKALQALAEGDDKEQAEKARAALAALAGKSAKAEGAEPDGDEGEPPHKEPDGDEGPGARAPDPALMAMSSKIQRLEAEAQERRDLEERRTLMAGRPDLAPEVRAWLDAQPLATVRSAVAALPRGAEARGPAVLDGAPTRGDGRGFDRDAEIDRQFKALSGAGPERLVERRDGGVVFNIATPAQIRAMKAAEGSKA